MRGEFVNRTSEIGAAVTMFFEAINTETETNNQTTPWFLTEENPFVGKTAFQKVGVFREDVGARDLPILETRCRDFFSADKKVLPHHLFSQYIPLRASIVIHRLDAKFRK